MHENGGFALLVANATIGTYSKTSNKVHSE